jgi:hypothetical protein
MTWPDANRDVMTRLPCRWRRDRVIRPRQPAWKAAALRRTALAAKDKSCRFLSGKKEVSLSFKASPSFHALLSSPSQKSLLSAFVCLLFNSSIYLKPFHYG